MTKTISKKILEQSFKDTDQDFEELLFLYSSSLSQIEEFLNELLKQKLNIPKGNFQTVHTQAKVYAKDFQEGIRFLKAAKNSIKKSKLSLTALKKLSDIKENYFALLRSQQGLIASLITSTDWQSPSFYYSVKSEAGRQTGKITPNISDYKRDQHLDEKSYQSQFLNEYVDGLLKLPVHVYLTGSGMSAFTTILLFLLMETKIKGPVILGRSSYFENKELVRKILGEKVIEVDEFDTKSVCQLIKEKKPSVLLFDSLSNTEEIAVPDLRTIINCVVNHAQKDTYIVIDNTCLSTFFQPLSLILGKTLKVHLIVFESLNKYHQFGMDRVTGGIIWAMGKDTGKLFYTREHSGTNILDSSTYVFPRPNRKLFERRLRRFERNTGFLASEVAEAIKENGEGKLEGVNYPKATYYKGFLWTKDLPFHGSFFSLVFKKHYQNIPSFKKFIQEIIKQARKQNVQITSGTSFGLNRTRIYLTASRTDYTKPFIRVSLGTEHRADLEAIKDIFVQVVKNF